MDGTRAVLELIRDHSLAAGHLRGLFHLAIGRTISRADGTVLSTGLSWRDLAQLLKVLKFDRELVRELGADPDSLSPKDRERFWYAAIALAKVDSVQARQEAEELAAALRMHGLLTGPAPGSPPPPPRAPKAAGPALPSIEIAESTEEISPAPKGAKRKKK